MSEEIEVNAKEGSDIYLPSWNACNKLALNESDLLRSGAIVDGRIVDDFYLDAKIPNPIHKFIYEYDCVDCLKSEAFIRRLQDVIEFARSEEGGEFLTGAQVAIKNPLALPIKDN